MNSITVEYVVVFLSAFILGWVLASIYFQLRLMQAIKMIEKNMLKLENNEESTADVPNYYLESNGNNYYLYDTKDSFVRQAVTIEKLAQDLYNECKIDFANVNYQGKTLQFDKGHVQFFDDR